MNWVYSSPEIYSPVFTPVTREQIQQAAASPLYARLRAIANARTSRHQRPEKLGDLGND